MGLLKNSFYRSFHCGTMGSAASWEHWNTGLIPGPAQWVKDLTLLQLWLSSWLQLRSDPWPGSYICHRVAKKKRTLSIISVAIPKVIKPFPVISMLIN